MSRRRGHPWAVHLLLLAALVVILAKSAHAATFTCAAGNDATTCAALGVLYAATGGAGWRKNIGWSAAAAGSVEWGFCSFTGVSCNNGVIISLCVHCMLAVTANACPRLGMHCANEMVKPTSAGS